MDVAGFTADERFMFRCVELATLGAGSVAPNPMVGAVLVCQDKIIGEGYHACFGQAHAEVNCIANVPAHLRHLIPSSTLYVSLEPCAHVGKTPPCTGLIITQKIPKVVIGARDPFEKVNGKGIEQLRDAGVTVTTDVLHDRCVLLNKRFFRFHQQRRPYVILKWAQTADGKIGSGNAHRLQISNEYTNRLVHKWRSEEAAILVGTNTALFDDPLLNLRWWEGKDPIRMVIDMDLRLPATLKLFNGQQPTVVFNKQKEGQQGNVVYYQLSGSAGLVQQVMNACYQRGLQSLIVEGGARLLQSFIDDGTWDEARVITNTGLFAGEGVAAPALTNAVTVKKEEIPGDTIHYFANNVVT